ncbi:superoxide dismutase family protein [Aliidiomarina shirensis]|uniref:Superoxide dismutase [Cu-Zn] n=1 Tax=Aliidiomarina shirensis TaxID=1048642 RepID=A0A432WTC2_9GAMM|nr:superoxide dismutase family protein [Aliidiomarina shirensis]RUO37016.1 superoxide dismutase family protein [Aliidiomarina shirensis]
MKFKTMLTAASAAVFLSACGGETNVAPESAPEEAVADVSEQQVAAGHGESAMADGFVAELRGTEGNEDVYGSVTFTYDDDGVMVMAHVEGLPANSTHGFHVHEFGDCSAPDATSAGGHFNPHNRDHGAPDSDERHVGDLGNLDSDASGMAHLEHVDHKLELEGENRILGKAVVIHAQADDLSSQPTGDAGARIACGVIDAVNSSDY